MYVHLMVAFLVKSHHCMVTNRLKSCNICLDSVPCQYAIQYATPQQNFRHSKTFEYQQMQKLCLCTFVKDVNTSVFLHYKTLAHGL